MRRLIPLPVLLLGVACTRAPAPDPGAAPAAWEWSAYPESDTLVLAQLPALAQPARTVAVRAPEAGRLHLTVRSRATTLPAGAEWARLEPPGFTAEAAELERAAGRIAQRRRQFVELELPAQRLRLDREIADAARAHELLELAEARPELFGTAPAALDPRLLPEGTTDETAEMLRLLHARRAQLDDAAQAEPAELAAATFDLERRHAAHTRRAELLRFTMPFAGELLLADAWLPRSDPDSSGPPEVAAGSVVAHLRDVSRLRLRIAAATPALAQAAATLPLVAVVHLGRHRLEVPFAFQQIEADAMGRESLHLYFEIEAAALQSTPFPPPGVELAAQVEARLPRPARRVPKLVVALAAPDAPFAEGWPAVVAAHWPGALLLAEGRTELALVPPGEPAAAVALP